MCAPLRQPSRCICYVSERVPTLNSFPLRRPTLFLLHHPAPPGEVNYSRTFFIVSFAKRPLFEQTGSCTCKEFLHALSMAGGQIIIQIPAFTMANNSPCGLASIRWEAASTDRIPRSAYSPNTRRSRRYRWLRRAAVGSTPRHKSRRRTGRRLKAPVAH